MAKHKIYNLSNKISCNQYVSRAALCHFILQMILLMLTNQTEYIYTLLLWSGLSVQVDCVTPPLQK